MKDPLDQPIYLLFTGEGPHLEFVEAENEDGESVQCGEWLKRSKATDQPTYRALKITPRSLLGALVLKAQPADPLRTDRPHTFVAPDPCARHRLQSERSGICSACLRLCKVCDLPENNMLHRVRDRDSGRAYVVVGIMHDGTEEAVGWTDCEDGGNLLLGVKEWPRYKDGEVRRADEESE